MKRKIIWIACWILAAAALGAFFTQRETAESESTYHAGRDKEEIAAGETLAWEWVPAFDTDTLSLQVSGKKNASGLTLKLSVSEGEKPAASAEWKAAEEDGDTPALSGAFRQGKKYTLAVEAAGEGSIKLRGERDDDGVFAPCLQAKGKTVRRNDLWLYLGLVLALFPLMPLPKETAS